jgi:hypothetical protein
MRPEKIPEMIASDIASIFLYAACGAFEKFRFNWNKKKDAEIFRTLFRIAAKLRGLELYGISLRV